MQLKFPKLTKLDNIEIAPTIGFDVTDDMPSVNLPPWKAVFMVDPSGSDLVSKFLEQYFMLYDSDNRQKLLDAYHEQTMFSMTCTMNQHYTPEEKLTRYIRTTRNLINPRGIDVRYHNLKRGSLNVVGLLAELPATQHDPQSFVVDLTVFTPQMIIFTVTGVFKERNSNRREEFVRIFQRTMVLVPFEGGFRIKNELLHINNASPAQAEAAFKPPVAPAPQMVMPAPQMVIPAVVSAPGAPDDAAKLQMQMIQAMSQQSNMNMEWSRKCLEETNWDYQRAGFVFSELFKQGKIPPEAFAK